MIIFSHIDSLGTILLNSFFLKKNNTVLDEKDLIDKCKQEFGNINFISKNIYLKVQWTHIDRLYMKNGYDIEYFNDAFGIHWFGGSHYSSTYINNFENKLEEYKKNNIWKKNCLIDELLQEYLDYA